ncbi:32856_t:CDS:1, partial [Racocetra persica]
EIFLAIGDTGLGKSFTAGLFGFTAKEGGNVNSTTKTVDIYKNEEYRYIDTPGFNDSNVTAKDDNTKLNILFKMQEENINFVHTIFWFVKCDIKVTQSLKKQAKFINDLAINSKSNVWDNTIIIFKGIKENLIEDPIKEAIREANNNNNLLVEPPILPVYLYEKLQPDSIVHMLNLTDEILCDFGIYKDKNKIRDKYKEIIQKNHHKDHPVQIVFDDEMCIKCGKKTDKRLSGRFPCHTSESLEHGDIEEYNYNTIYRHTGQLITVQDHGWDKADRIVRQVPLFGLFGGIITGIGKEATQRTEWSCCQRAYGSRGCKEEHSTGVRYSCCHKDVNTKPPGCKKVCKYCGKAWGKLEGCTNHSQYVFVK